MRIRRFLYQQTRPSEARPVANSGRAAGKGTGDTGDNAVPVVKLTPNPPIKSTLPDTIAQLRSAAAIEGVFEKVTNKVSWHVVELLHWRATLK